MDTFNKSTHFLKVLQKCNSSKWPTNSWKILDTTSNDDAKHYYFLSDTKQANFRPGETYPYMPNKYDTCVICLLHYYITLVQYFYTNVSFIRVNDNTDKYIKLPFFE